MPTRLVLLLAFFLAVPALGQQANMQARIAQKVDQREQGISQVAAAPAIDAKMARLQVVHQDANELSALSESVQSELRKLQEGLLVKDLNTNLKKMEKLSKKLRREME